MTPKKSKQDSVFVKPPLQSPAGPMAVRSSQFKMIGYVVFSLREIHRTHFTLNKVISEWKIVSPKKNKATIEKTVISWRVLFLSNGKLVQISYLTLMVFQSNLESWKTPVSGTNATFVWGCTILCGTFITALYSCCTVC